MRTQPYHRTVCLVLVTTALCTAMMPSCVSRQPAFRGRLTEDARVELEHVPAQAKDLKAARQYVSGIAKHLHAKTSDCSIQDIGPNEKGIVLGCHMGSVVGNSVFQVYRYRNGYVTLIGSFGGCDFRFLSDQVSNDLYNVYTMWHMSAAGGPYKYYRWNGEAYEVYRSGDLQKENRPTKE